MEHTDVWSFEAQTIGGQRVKLSRYQGKVLLIVNTASQCGFTPQFDGLQALWQAYQDQGLVVLGFPSNQFGGQDPGANDEIASFCQLNYGVSFPMMAKIEVNGTGAHPLYRLAHPRSAGPARQPGDQVELHQVPGRPRRQDDQALRAAGRAGQADPGHRGRAGGVTPLSPREYRVRVAARRGCS